MKIGFDAKRSFCNNTGLGNYSRLMIDVLSKYYPENIYNLYTPKDKHNPRITDIISRDGVNTCLPVTKMARTFSSLWRVSDMIVKDLKHDEINLFHGLSNELPLTIASSGIPSVVTIHDLIFLRYPEYYHPIDRGIYNYKFRKACENSTRIIAISECTKRDIIDYYGIEESKIDIVYQGCSEIFSLETTDERKREVAISLSLPKRFIIYVGTIESRKNLLLAVRALEKIDPSIHLVVVGGKRKYFNTVMKYIDSHKLNNRVHFYENLSFDILPVLYKLALASVYPSRFEGFGIPILESITCGTPSVCCTGSCLEEAGGDGALYVDPDDVEGFASAVNSIIEEGELRQKMIKNGLEYAQKFSHEAIARNLMNIYRKTLDI